MKIEFQPIASIHDVASWHPIVEVMTLFSGSCSPTDLEWDEDELLRSLIEDTNDPELRADYEAEPAFGIREAKDRFLSDLKEIIEAQTTLLGAHSPFEINSGSGLILKRRDAKDTTEAGLAYAWLVMFWAISLKPDFIVISKTDRDAFGRAFAYVFEYICSMVMIARSPTAVWYFGDSRDVNEFMRRLATMVLIAGSGTVKSYAELEENQVGANDAGVDVLAIELHNGAVRSDSVTYLIGATIQKSDRRHKILGIDQVRRFSEYFTKKPKLAYKGILAIPFDATENEHLNCRDKNCLYISKAEILASLAAYPSTDPVRLAYIQRPRRAMLKRSRALQSEAKLISKAGELQISWG